MNIIERFANIINHNKPVVIEVGACDGMHTNIMCSTIKARGIQDYEFHSFEPSPDLTNAFLSRNLQHFPNLKFVPAAVGAKDGVVDFYLSSGEESRDGHFKQSFYGSSSIKEPDKCSVYWPDMKFRKIQSKCYRLDTYCAEQKMGKIDFIWADVQGAERDLIEGGTKALSNTRFFYTEISRANQYKDIGYEEAEGIMKLLPGKWSIVENYGDDVLFKNELLGS